MIIIDNILLLFYNIKISKYVSNNDKKLYFQLNNNNYIIRSIDYFDLDMVSTIENNKIFNIIIQNKFQNMISTYNDKKYVLMKIRTNIQNKKINIEDLIYILSLNNSYIKKNYYIIWLQKIDYIEKYIKDYDLSDYDINYYLGLSNIALNIVKKIDFNNITCGLTYKRFYNINYIFDLLDPFNLCYGAKVDALSEFIKYSFFYKKEKIKYEAIFNLNLNINDYILFIARLIFPTYFFDLLEENNISEKYSNIINSIDRYKEYLKEIIYKIKKRYNLSFLEYIINLL